MSVNHTYMQLFIHNTHIHGKLVNSHTIKLLSLSSSTAFGLTLILFTSIAQLLECNPYSTKLYSILKKWNIKYYPGQVGMCSSQNF